MPRKRWKLGKVPKPSFAVGESATRLLRESKTIQAGSLVDEPARVIRQEQNYCLVMDLPLTLMLSSTAIPEPVSGPPSIIR